MLQPVRTAPQRRRPVAPLWGRHHRRAAPPADLLVRYRRRPLVAGASRCSSIRPSLGVPANAARHHRRAAPSGRPPHPLPTPPVESAARRSRRWAGASRGDAVGGGVPARFSVRVLARIRADPRGRLAATTRLVREPASDVGNPTSVARAARVPATELESAARSPRHARASRVRASMRARSRSSSALSVARSPSRRSPSRRSPSRRSEKKTSPLLGAPTSAGACACAPVARLVRHAVDVRTLASKSLHACS
jgi:hypothetical protein